MKCLFCQANKLFPRFAADIRRVADDENGRQIVEIDASKLEEFMREHANDPNLICKHYPYTRCYQAGNGDDNNPGTVVRFVRVY